MPMKAAVREMLPPKRMIWAFRYSRSNSSRASRSGRAMIRSAPEAAGRRPGDMASDGQHVGGDRLGRDRPAARIRMRSTTLRSWRTLPGQACTCSVAIASSPKPRRGRPVRVADALDEVVDQLGDVLAPLRQARHAQRHHVQAVEQVLAEAAGGDLLAQVARRSTRSPARRPARRCRRRRGGSAARPAPAGCGPGSRAACRRLRRGRGCRRGRARTRRSCAAGRPRLPRRTAPGPSAPASCRRR